MEPFYQGALDSLCGVYNIINAVKKTTKNIDSENLFAEIINHLDNKKNLSEIMLKGINRQTLSGIFNDVVGDKVKISSPFWSKPNTSLDLF
ncbi:MAG: hypothetical protein GY730_00990 [bacterium]|nr:hypothetical protein [bacterium]